MASTATKKRSGSVKRTTTRRSSKVGDMTREELRDLLTQIIDERLPRLEHNAPRELADFDWIAAAREVRSRAPASPDSTPLLRALREVRARR